MPRRRLDVQYRLLHLVQRAQVLVKDGLDLDQTAQDLRSSLTGKVRHFCLVSFLTSGKVYLTLAHLYTQIPACTGRLQGDTKISFTSHFTLIFRQTVVISVGSVQTTLSTV